MLVNPAAPRPISAGIHPELESMLSTASTLKLENVAPPISGSLMSAPSIANVASTPRWPLMANCAVKLVAPLASVMVPAASSSSVLKSRLFSGSSLTAWLDNSSPPVPVWFFSSSVATVSSPRPESVKKGLPAVSPHVDRLRILHCAALGGNRQVITARRQQLQLKSPVGIGARLSFGPAGTERDFGVRNRSSARIAQRAAPHRLRCCLAQCTNRADDKDESKITNELQRRAPRHKGFGVTLFVFQWTATL